jgi:hypothetical protein
MSSNSANMRLSWLENWEHINITQVPKPTRNIIIGKEDIMKRLPHALQTFGSRHALNFDNSKVNIC